MSDDLWRWADPDGQQRKVRLDELRAALAGGRIPPNTLVWRPGWSAWQTAHEVPELTSASLGGANGIVLNIPPPPLEMVAVQQQYEAEASTLMSAPPPPVLKPHDEPPPPPTYVPAPTLSPSIGSSSGDVTTQVGGSAFVPLAPGSAPAGEGSPPAPGSNPKLAPSLPTALGLPPPPDLATRTRPRSMPPPVPTRPRPPAPIEELSASMLVDADSAQDLPDADDAASNGVVGVDGLPPPTTPVIVDAPADTSLDAIAGIPPRSGLDLILEDIAAMRERRLPKHKVTFAVVGALGLSLLIVLVAGIVSLFGGGSATHTKTAAATASALARETPPAADATASATAAEVTAAASPPEIRAAEPPSTILGECTRTGESKLIAPRALVASGIEAYAFGDTIAIGFAAGPRDAVALSLDPRSLAATKIVRVRPSGGDARRVTPILSGSSLEAIADVDRKGDRLLGRRVVATSTLVDVGVAGSAIAAAPHGEDAVKELFALDGDAPVEALRAIPLADTRGIAVTFRRSGAVFVGTARGEGVPSAEGELSRFAGLGGKPGTLGSPVVASSGDRVIAAWADRADTDADWGVRLAIRGAADADVSTFAIPPGGLGEQAMSPSLAPLGGGGFLLAWTEGPVSNHQVRAVTMSADGTPYGAPITISDPALNAGQPAAAVGVDGRGVVAFLAAKGKSLEVYATSIHCTPR